MVTQLLFLKHYFAHFCKVNKIQKYHILHGSDISLVPILGEFVDSRRMISGLNSICAGNQCCSDLLTAVRRIASRAIC